ncbi:hypothetical protein [Flocculibacter collagenilyticus]|uniref:hypothetical protein n=1 Tax=Flocculibacter collagenilyticus TaxID=2744479 RepID=UPI0018F52D40|nr:hypothetical protein [Flocculibacter collagenilyticus]
MNSIPDNKKLQIIYRVEPGCLGPEGMKHVEGFCQYAETEFSSINSDIINWKIVPRFDKALPELQYSILGKTLSEQKTTAYLSLFDKELAPLEDLAHEELALMIEKYFDR